MRTALAVLLTTLPLAAGAAPGPCASHVTAEAWTERDYRIVGIDLSVVECANTFSAARFGLSYYAYDRLLFEGITGSLRLQVGKRWIPYVGVGALAGWAEIEEESEDSEETEVREEFTGFVYPEFGLMYLPTGTFGIALTARRYYGHEFEGDFVYSVGATVRIPR
jgi:hypothetical protein